MSVLAEIVHGGKTYYLTYGESIDDLPAWVDATSHMKPPIRLQNSLNRLFLDNHADKVMSDWGKDNLISFYQLLKAMGASNAHLIQLGLGFLVEGENSHEWYPRSPLHAMGYKVGKTDGLPINERRAILRDAFLNELENIGTAEYMLRWGLPGTKERLASIARHIRFKSLNPNNDNSQAFADWQDDLEWLKATFYDGTFTFPWPG